MIEHVDPVCGMRLAEHEAVGSLDYGGQVYYFCSEDCLNAFRKDPAPYLNATG